MLHVTQPLSILDISPSGHLKYCSVTFQDSAKSRCHRCHHILHTVGVTLRCVFSGLHNRNYTQKLKTFLVKVNERHTLVWYVVLSHTGMLDRATITAASFPVFLLLHLTHAKEVFLISQTNQPTNQTEWLERTKEKHVNAGTDMVQE